MWSLPLPSDPYYNHVTVYVIMWSFPLPSDPYYNHVTVYVIMLPFQYQVILTITM